MKLFSTGSEAAQPVPSDVQEPLLARQVSRQSYGSNGSPTRLKNGNGTERARSKRRRTGIRSSVYAEPPASYRTALISYTLTVTLSSCIFLILFGVLKIVCWPHELHPSPLREFLLAAGAWTVAFALRLPILFLSTIGNTYVNAFTTTLSTFLQVFTQEALRLAILVLIQLHLERPGKQHAGKTFSSFLFSSDPTTPIPGPTDPDLDWAPLPDVWDRAFTQVWWLGMGWATADVVVGIVQGYEQLSLYRDVLARDRRERSHAHTSSPSPSRQKRVRSSQPTPRDPAAGGLPPLSSTRSLSNLASTRPGGLLHLEPAGEVPPASATRAASVVLSSTPQRMLTSENVTENNTNGVVGADEPIFIHASARDLEAELSHLITRKQRAELEEVYGSPLPRIPIFLIALQRLDSILLSLGLTLLVSSAYLRALYLPAFTTPETPPYLDGSGTPRYKLEWEVDWRRVKDTTIPVFATVVLVHFLLSILWIEALPRVGVHTASYVGLLVSLAMFFAGLGYWGALV